MLTKFNLVDNSTVLTFGFSNQLLIYFVLYNYIKFIRFLFIA